MPHFRRTGFPVLILALGLTLLLTEQVRAEAIYFIAKGIGGKVPVANLNRDPSKPASASVAEALSASVVAKYAPDGKQIIALTDATMNVRSFSLNADDQQLVCYRAGGDREGRLQTELLIISPEGKPLRQVSLTESGYRVLGTPVLLPGNRQVGLTVCKVDPPADPSKRNEAKTAQERAEIAMAMMKSQEQWNAGTIPSQPKIAVLDLASKSIKEIGEGVLPSWSPDGKTITFTELTFDDWAIKGYRQMAMSADGENRHPIAPEGTGFGALSADGKHVAYLAGNADEVGFNFIVADADGKNAKTLSDGKALFAQPRWLGRGSRELLVRAVGVMKNGTPMRNNFGDLLWEVTSDGSKLHELENTEKRRLLFDEDFEWLLLRLAQRQYAAASGLDPGKADAPAGGPPSVRNTPRGTPPAGAPATGQLPPGFMPAPAVVEFEGTKVFTRDAKGMRIPLPDGNYVYRGLPLRVRGGHQITISN